MHYALLILFLLLPVAAQAVAVTPTQQALTQGGYYMGQTDPRATIHFSGKTLKPTTSGHFVLGFDRNAEPEQSFKACLGTTCTTTTLLVTPRTFPTQAVRGVSNKHVNPDPEQVARAGADNAAIGKARSQQSTTNHFSSLFATPVISYTTTGIFGSRRTYNGEERSWHKGLDFAAPTGTPVYAPANATVTLARDTFFNGNLLILDHGNSLFSIYAHLSRMDVKAGDKVKEGDIIGAIGTTGRSTGPHLHWGVYWGNIALDPALFLRQTVSGGNEF